MNLDLSQFLNSIYVKQDKPAKVNVAGTLLMISLSTFLLYNWFFSEGSISNIDFYSFIICFLTAVPIVNYLINQSFTSFPILPLICLFYFFQFGLGPLVLDYERTYYMNYVSEEAQIIVIYGLIAFFVTYYISSDLLFRKRKERTFFPTMFDSKLLLHFCLFVVALSAVQQVYGLGVLSQFVIVLFPICFIVCFYLIYRVHKGWLYKLLFFLLFVVICVARISSGLLAEIYEIGFLITVFFFLMRRNRWTVVFLLILVFILRLYSPVKFMYRQETWEGSHSHETVFEKFMLFNTLAIDNFVNGEEDDVSNNDFESGRTFASIFIFSKVVDKTPGQIDYHYGSTAAGFFNMFLPRFLFPDKPQLNFGNEFGRMYGFLAYNDVKTSVNCPWLVEFYINFGLAGVIVGFIICGLLFATINWLINSNPALIFDKLIFSASSFSLWYQESQFSTTVFFLLPSLIFTYFVFHLLNMLSKQQ